MSKENGTGKIKKPSGRGSDFAFQAAVLAGAGILSRVIGLLYRSPLFQILGDEGNGYYGTAYNIYAMILMIATYSIPTAVSKIISGKLALGEYKSAKRVFRCAFVYVVIAGGIAAIITYIGAPWFVGEHPNAIISLRILAPTIFLSGFLAIFRGYLQAYNTMVPTSISQILEQIANAVVSIMAAYFLSRPFAPGTSEHAKYGAAGSAMGTGAGVLCGIIFILLAYTSKRKEIDAAIAQDKTVDVESYGKLFKQIIIIMTPIIVAAFVYNIVATVDMKVFYMILGDKGVDKLTQVNLYGVYSGQFTVLMNVPVAIAASVGIALIPNISGAYTKGDMKASNHFLNEALSITMLVTIPCAVGMGVLAKPIMDLLFKGADPLAAKSLTVGCIAIVFYSLSTVTTSVLQGIGKVMEPVKNATIALLLHLIFLAALLKYTKLDLYALILGTIFYSLLMCIFNAASVRRYQNAGTDFKRIYLAPTIASLFMGVVAYGSYKLIYMILPSNTVSLFAAIILAIIFYAVAIIKAGGYSEAELEALPKGASIVRLAKKLHLFKSL
ncbi:MAG: polysaccharide biosynthesis protein [Coprococcus sp.]|nr:polysaccharide biosynthesis protein [Coprococcus sp.]